MERDSYKYSKGCYQVAQIKSILKTLHINSVVNLIFFLKAYSFNLLPIWRDKSIHLSVYVGCIIGLGSYKTWEDSPGEGNGYPFQYSGLENSMVCIVLWVIKSQTRLGNFHFTIIVCNGSDRKLNLIKNRMNHIAYPVLRKCFKTGWNRQ